MLAPQAELLLELVFTLAQDEWPQVEPQLLRGHRPASVAYCGGCLGSGESIAPKQGTSAGCSWTCPACWLGTSSPAGLSENRHLLFEKEQASCGCGHLGRH